MSITQAQLRTLNLLHAKPASRVYRSDRFGDYTWVHDDAEVRLTATLHKLFSSGYATLSPDNRNAAVLTAKGRAVLAARVMMVARAPST
ncbi:hypothetical protein [Microvirga calopogonii]|uniref:hypothetical protein n=1 Tax=Microvirga calopogonii TaxID=2078013 RepID=UPI0013B43B44|nr:hypothetical protein [Microvirga calopogonii]